ncbi:MAG: hypothetical protein ABL890_02965 [Candidatus Peribacteraceae bacterium]
MSVDTKKVDSYEEELKARLSLVAETHGASADRLHGCARIPLGILAVIAVAVTACIAALKTDSPNTKDGKPVSGETRATDDSTESR